MQFEKSGLIVCSFDIFRFWDCAGCVAGVSLSRWVVAEKVAWRTRLLA